MCALMVNIASILMAVWSQLSGLTLELAWGWFAAGPLRVGGSRLCSLSGEQSICSAAGTIGWRWGHMLPQEARLWHAVITVSFTGHERDGGREGKHDGANNYLVLRPLHILFLLVKLRAGGGCSFESGVSIGEIHLSYDGEERLWAFFSSPQKTAATATLYFVWPIKVLVFQAVLFWSILLSVWIIKWLGQHFFLKEFL